MSMLNPFQGFGEESQGRVITGVVIGIVTNNQDPEGLGRVKVKFPWRGESDESYWARIATLMAGKERGTFFLPEVGDEVLVAFDHGDIDHPYVIGALWNGVDKPPETNADGKNNIRKIKSRSGHEIIFDDNSEGKKEKLELHTNAGHTIVLDDSAGKEKMEIHTKAGHTILLDDSPGKEKIEIKDKTGNNSIKIDSVQNAITISSQMKLTLKAQAIDIESGGMMNIKSGGMMGIKSSGILNIQGTLVKIN